MALFSGFKFAGIFLLLACYMRGSKCYEIQENYDFSNFSDILGRSDHHHRHHHEERARTMINVAYLTHQSISTIVSIAMEEFNSPHAPTNTYPMDCAEIQEQDPSKQGGMYEIWPRSRNTKGSFIVNCDFIDDGGGWTIIQRRGPYGSSQDYFYRGWEAYKYGFGDPLLDFWIGNDLIHALCNQRECSLKFYLMDWDGNITFAQYENFHIDDGNHNYQLHVSGYRGNAGDSFSYANDLPFSTRDRDNDLSQSNCAELFKGAWWYLQCHESNLNGLYLGGHHQSFGDGVNWRTFRGLHYSHMYTDMRVRPKDWRVTRRGDIPQG